MAMHNLFIKGATEVVFKGMNKEYAVSVFKNADGTGDIYITNSINTTYDVVKGVTLPAAISVYTTPLRVVVHSLAGRKGQLWRLGLNPRNELPKDFQVWEDSWLEGGYKYLYQPCQKYVSNGKVLLQRYRKEGSLYAVYYKVYCENKKEWEELERLMNA